MSTPILTTKLYIPPPRTKVVLRPRLVEQLNEGLHRKLTLISAPAGFGKTTLVSEWITHCDRPTAWMSLDEGDNDPLRFLAYLVAALQTIDPTVGERVLGILQSPQPPPFEAILTTLLNEIVAIPDQFVLVLDDYHVIDAKPIDQTLSFLVDHLPPQMHLVIVTREDPQIPVSRLRVRNDLTELRATNLRFTLSEAAGFLNQVMNLDLSADDIDALETRTEGWIAGLQLAALALQGTISSHGHQDASDFIKSFTGSHHFVLDYLVEEVLHQQPENVQTFLLQTSILDRMCGSLCDAVLQDSSASGQATLEYLERANLFLVPLDNERRWYRYHHLFADLLRQRLLQNLAPNSDDGLAELHQRASAWYEDNGWDIEAFHHAVAADDIENASRLLLGDWMPLQFRGAVAPVLNWLASLPTSVLDERPLLWVMYASALSMTGQTTGLESKLQAAEAAVQDVELNAEIRNVIGHVAAIRALLAAVQYKVDVIISESQRALEYLHPDNLSVRTATIWKLGFAYQLQGDRAAAAQAYTEAIAISETSQNMIVHIAATIGLGNIQEEDNQLYTAAQTYKRVLRIVGDSPQRLACEAHLGLARIYYEWNDLDTAQHHAERSVEIVRLIENTDRGIACEAFIARLKLSQGDVEGAAALLAKAERSVHQYDFTVMIPEIIATQVLILLRQDKVTEAAHLMQQHDLPISQARVYLAEGNTSEALTVLEPFRQQMEVKNWQDQRLRIMVLEAIALYQQGNTEAALGLINQVLSLAKADGFIRLFVDEGLPMAQLLSEAATQGIMTDYVDELLAVFEAEGIAITASAHAHSNQSLIEPLSERELEVLELVAEGLSNREISERLFLALSTVKGHNRIIFDKLQVQRRTEAVARARDLGLL